jgi:tungstate transport system ATP-binding protein
VNTLIEVHQASVLFGQRSAPVRALHGISLQVKAGERVALIGSNGCGKSTVLRLLHGLIQPSMGTVQSQAQLRQAMVFQRPYLMRMSLQSNLAFGLFLKGLPWRQARQRALYALEHVGLAELAGRNARTLSGGQQQRAALARACALAPQLLLLDEPTASLDPHAKREVESLMDSFARGELNPSSDGLERAMVFASHNLGQVKRLASRVVYLERGEVMADLPVAQFFDEAYLESHCPHAQVFVRGESL